MTDQPLQFPRFYVTAPAPCPYLPGKVERKVFTELQGENPEALNESLGKIGFRRSQNVAYRPSCEGCNACVSVRVVTNEFVPSTNMRRVLRRNEDLVVTACEPWTTSEQFELLQRYLAHRHPTGGMAKMDVFDYADMVERTPVTSAVVEYRLPAPRGGEPHSGDLVGACLTDHYSDGLSMVYSFYDPALEKRGLGTFIILDHIQRAAAHGLPYVYLGYWIDGCDRMSYKRRFRPVEQLKRGAWERMADEDLD